ncbi:MAG: hypothetical protein GY711_05300 [bacterium]|nr:hypothetical protein [bacterium]
MSARSVLLTVVLVFGVVFAVETARLSAKHVAAAAGPTVGFVVAGTVAVALGYLIVRVLRHPTRRFADDVAGQLDYRMERHKTGVAIARLAESVDERQRARMTALSARVFERASRALTEGQLQAELEELKLTSERVVQRAQSNEIGKIIARHQAALWRVNACKNMSANEKASLLREMRSLLLEHDAASDAEPAPPADPFAMDAQPEVVWEYRTPGSEAVAVTTPGLLKLVERGRLAGGDECRRLGTRAWTPVADVFQ